MLTARKAFLKSLPVMGGYVVLGMGFGILARRAGYGPLWVLAMSLLIYAGSMQYVGVGLLQGGAPELIAGALVIALQAWKHNALLSILGGTAAYMLLVQLVFR